MTFRCDKLVQDLIDIITLSGDSWRQTQGFTSMARHLGISIAVLLVIGSSITLASEHDHKAKLFTGKKNSSITVDMVVDYLIHKYSTEESVLSFEGYENLLQHLDLGMVDNHHSEEANLNAPSAQSLDSHENHHDHQRHFDIGPIDMQGKQQKLHLHCFQYNHDKETSNPEGSKKHTDNGYQSNQADHHDHGHHADHGDHGHHADHGDHDDHEDHGGHGDDTEHDHTDHGNHSSHNDHNDHHDDGDHSNHAGHTGDHDDDNDHSDHDQSDHGTHTDHDHTDNEDRGNHSDDQADHSDHGAHTDHDHTDHGVHGNQGAHTDHDHADHGNHGAHNDHNHTDHGDHSDHGAHTGHDHTDHGDHGNHGAHTDHDHTDHGDHGNQGAHTDHDHADHGNQGAHNDHDHTDHGDHRDHGAHTDHDHTDHGDHGNHGAHTDLDHTDHEDHGNHSDDQADHSDHGAHTDHDHGIHSDHTGHDHRDHDDDNSHSDHTVHNHTGHGDHSDHDHTEHSGHEDDSDFARVKRSLEKAVEKTHQRDLIDFRNTCLRPKEILQLMRFSDNALTKEQFIELCPLLIVQLDGHACDHSHDHHHVHSHGHEVGKSNVNYKTWLYACGSIVVISLSGLICVGVLSLLHHMFVQNFLHFLVAMAVGALTGDAMLHLLPHALSSSDGHDHGSGEAHDMDGVFKGLAGLSIFYFFFLFGRIQDIASIRKMKKRKQQTEDLESIGVTMVIRAPDEEGNMVMDRVVNVKEEEANAKEPLGHSHGHSHSHGHDDLPTSTGAMVWRVIVGDGIHNFSDGLAIGVAFADSVTSGLSTAIAVLCHELPHEIGDFAVLLKKGMSIRQALGFNCLSSALSMIGVLVGVAMGNITGIKFYILVCVAGMFIYISLVDMLPEISSSPTQKPVRNLVFTMMGICVGSGIMLAIALKEDELAMITA